MPMDHEAMWDEIVSLRETLMHERARYQEVLKAERDLSDAYLRIRKLLDAWDTPTAPTPEQVWEHTEARLQRLRDDLAREKAAREKTERKLVMLAHGWSVVGAPADFTEEGIICAFRHHADVIDRLVAKMQRAERERDEALVTGSDLLERLRKAEEDSARLLTARSYEDWHEDIGAVLWWNFPIQEPPYCGTPLDSDYPYDDNDKPCYIYWTPLPDCNEIQGRHDAARGTK